MIAKDMKYTALYWALRFVETDPDVHVKDYGENRVTVYADRREVDFGKQIHCEGCYPLTQHSGFVVLELVDRLLSNGTKPEEMWVTDGAILRVNSESIRCVAWEDYSAAKASDAGRETIYSSRLVSGLLECRGIRNGVPFGSGANPPVCKSSPDFRIDGDELVQYTGTDEIVIVPEGVVSIGASAFWNNTRVKEVILPDSLERLGGDCFYYCTNLETVCIPKRVSIMGNNPFAGCPKLALQNTSPDFLLEDGVLYDREKKNLIYYPVNNLRREFTVPDGVFCLGKHCFFACNNLEHITIPASVIHFENNPFSGCSKLRLTCNTPYYIVENGVIYNKFRTTIIGCLNGSQIGCLTIPESVTLISRNSFWNCKGVRKIVLTKNVDRIGYNPFAGCENLLIENSGNPNYCVENGIVFDKARTHLLCATDRAVGTAFRVPDGVTHINRGVFSGCLSLRKIDFGGVTYIDKSSFTNCTGLTELYIPDAVTYIGEWAFSYCTNLRKISVNTKTFIDKNAFNECPVTVEWRE